MAKPSTLPVEQTSVATLHQELAAWRQQNSLWFDELSAWHKEHELALLALAELEKTYHGVAETTRTVRDELTTHEQRLHAHERCLADYLQGSSAIDFAALEQQHRTAAAQQAEHKKQIDRAKQLVHGMMVKMDAVRRALAN